MKNTIVYLDYKATYIAFCQHFLGCSNGFSVYILRNALKKARYFDKYDSGRKGNKGNKA